MHLLQHLLVLSELCEFCPVRSMPTIGMLAAGMHLFTRKSLTCKSVGGMHI